VFGNVRSAGDCSVWALLIGFTCGFGDVEVGDVEVGDEALRDDVLGVLTGGWPVGLLGPLTGSADVLVVVGADLVPIDAGDSGLGNTCELVRAPPVICTMPVSGSGVVDDGEFKPVGEVDPDDELDELDERLDGLVLLVDDEADEEDELEDEGLDDEFGADVSANATPGMVASADPTPSAIANAPTRPT
jgi:hypothetical protein